MNKLVKISYENERQSEKNAVNIFWMLSVSGMALKR